MVRTTFTQPSQEDARIQLARTMFFAGCLALPWLWVVNVWYFFPTVFRSNGDGSPELTKWVRRSMTGAVVSVTLFFVWILIFQLNWRRWGRPAVDFMVFAPSSYTTGW